MDKNNIIGFTDDLNILEQDMRSWLSLPYNDRVKSDKVCLETYKMSNVKLYNTLKSKIISGTLPKKEFIRESFLEASFKMEDEELDVPLPDYGSEEYQDFLWKKQISNELNKSPYIVIITPFYNKPDIDLEDLIYQYSEYNLLSDKDKLISNSYSRDIWGYDVYNMYQIIRSRLEEDDSELLFDEINDFMYPTIEQVNESIIWDDKIKLLQIKLDSCSPNISNSHRAIYENLSEKIDNHIYNHNYSSCIPTVVPYFTEQEMQNLCPNNKLGILNPKLYYKALKVVIETEEENEILSMGWNPSVPLNEKSIKFARDRQINYINNNAPMIIDITKMEAVDEVVHESSKSAEKMYREKGLYPVYIVLSFTGTAFGKVITKWTHCKFSHAGISLDSSLKDIYTFKFDSFANGFGKESIDQYIQIFNDSYIGVLCIFVTDRVKKSIENIIEHFEQVKDKTKYGFGNVLNIAMNRSIDFDPDNLSLVCSQFVDTVLKLANIDVTGQSSNLVSPSTFFKKCEENPKIYKVYDGYTRDYDKRKIEKNIKSLFRQFKNDKDTLINKLAIAVAENFTVESFDFITENEKANAILEEIRYLLTPEAVIVERDIPIKFTNKGDLSIDLFKSLEEEYQESHKLLVSYNNTNIDGIKHELARLFFINSAIEKKIKKMKSGDDTYQSLINLRARVLNDFKKYFKVVSEQEPDFNFAEYFKKSEYYNGAIRIDNATIRYTGSFITKFLRAQGI